MTLPIHGRERRPLIARSAATATALAYPLDISLLSVHLSGTVPAARVYDPLVQIAAVKTCLIWSLM